METAKEYLMVFLLILAAVLMVITSPIWVATYFIFGIPDIIELDKGAYSKTPRP